MQWNDLDYEMQMKILDRIGDLIFQEEDESMQFGIAAAITELEIWSNSPIREVLAYEELSKDTPLDSCGNHIVSPEFIQALRNAGADEKLVVQLEKEAAKAGSCCHCKISWFCKCLCHKKGS